MTDDVKKVVQWLRIMGVTKDGDIIDATATQPVMEECCVQVEDVVVPAADLLENLSYERDQWKARCEAAERDLNRVLSLCRRQCYEACYFCAMPDDDTCITGAEKGLCNAVWRGPRGENNE